MAEFNIVPENSVLSAMFTNRSTMDKIFFKKREYLMAKGQELKAQRQKNGLSQTQVARHLNVTRQTISSWERGRTLPDSNSLQKLSKLYHEEGTTEAVAPVAQIDNRQTDEGLLLLMCALVSLIIMPLGLIAAPILIKRNKASNRYYRLIYLISIVSLLTNLLILAAIIADRFNWGITSYH
ncbi:helix-turn-helix transcriptional regulator [Oenococcus sicerae]|uniref:Helix-turn-helix transcriptional regulator n=1 Tax=Oenococcus sicerae TaxID=2203724 RepID=A0AAJ1RAS6_9LACO|nr:helix-turn-helix transcriptional regulator [Oenococcus sicerae]MDN6900163.1 XRE family transcriptional regulator [Oenococcus sicerae]QAS69769.1 helix-turn-helix transcriptional regulator [Oenococcus sicerae]